MVVINYKISEYNMVSVKSARSIILFLALTTSAANATETLDQILEETTRIATKTKLNVDYVPSVVSVLRGYEGSWGTKSL